MIFQILTEMDGVEELHNVTIIAATNRPDLVDLALLRPGRFDRLVYIPPPDLEARKGIFAIHTKGKPLGADVVLDDLAPRAENYTGAEIAAVCNEAAMLSIRDFLAAGGTLDDKYVKKLVLKKDHFSRALEKVRPRSKEELRRYHDLSSPSRNCFEVASAGPVDVIPVRPLDDGG